MDARLSEMCCRSITAGQRHHRSKADHRADAPAGDRRAAAF
jgi:hypothetical protein